MRGCISINGVTFNNSENMKFRGEFSFFFSPSFSSPPIWNHFTCVHAWPGDADALLLIKKKKKLTVALNCPPPEIELRDGGWYW